LADFLAGFSIALLPAATFFAGAAVFLAATFEADFFSGTEVFLATGLAGVAFLAAALAGAATFFAETFLTGAAFFVTT